MREITPDVDAQLQWFDYTHEVTFDHGIPRWRRQGLPRNGAVGAQDAHDMMALDFLLDVHQAALAASVRRQQDAAQRVTDTERGRRG